jgi:hypothetical protein|tara:strand:- start:605 stop:1081 length:477 start_codon:yes stop_codon:yes gene_type:complete
MATLREYLNAKIKSKGSTLAKEKAKAKKYKSISAAKKAGALYYTNKAGKVMAAVFAEDLKKPLAPKKSDRPKARPKPVSEAVFVERENTRMKAEEKAAYEKKLLEAMNSIGITDKTRKARGFDPMNLAGPSAAARKKLAAKKLAAKKKKPAKKKSNIK